MNNNYFNLTISVNEVSYQPYMYDKSDSNAYLILGAVLALPGLAFAIMGIYENAMYPLVFFGLLVIVSGLYRVFFKVKKTFVFNKTEDAVFQISPLGKKKLIAISNVYGIATVSENMSYTYQLTNKQKASAKPIDISSFFTEKRNKKEAFIFFEETIIPMLHKLLGLEDVLALNNSNTTT